MGTTDDTAAVVVDRLPLFRIGMRRAVHEAGLGLVGEAADVAGALDALGGRNGGVVVVVGDAVEAGPAALARASAHALVVGLVGAVGRDDLVGVLGAGVAGIGLRSSGPAELADLLRRAVRGERAVAPALVPTLAGMGPQPTRPVPASREAGELTARELAVLAALAAGASNAEIAAELFVSQATVKTHLGNIYAKLQVRGRHEALARAVALGLVG